MTPAAALAAGLLSLTLATACAQDETQRATAAPAGDAGGPPSAATASAPAVRAEMSVEPTAAGAAPTAAVTRPAPPAAAITSPAAAPRPAAPAPAPGATKTSTAAPPASAPRPTTTTTSSQAASPTPKPAAAQYALTIKDFAFSPRLLTIPVGSTVTATNQDGATHDWTSRSSVWRSGDLPQGSSYSFTFSNSGTFDYLCERHPQMTGTITVTPR